MYEKLKEMLCDELHGIVTKGEVSNSNLDKIDKLTHSIKSLDTIIAMEDYGDEHSGRRYYRDSYNNGNMSYNNGNSYARGRTGNIRRDSMGRYSGDGDMMSILEEHARNTDNPMKRREIESFMERIRNM